MFHIYFIFGLTLYKFREKLLKYLENNDFTYGVYIYHMLIVNVMLEKGFTGGGTKPPYSSGTFYNFWNTKLFFSRKTVFENEEKKVYLNK